MYSPQLDLETPFPSRVGKPAPIRLTISYEKGLLRYSWRFARRLGGGN